MPRWMVCFHIPDFGSRALVKDPREKVVVSWRGRVWTWSESLGECGLRTDDTVQRARALCPGARLLDRDLHREFMLRERLLHQLYSATPQVMLLPDPSLPGLWALLQNPVGARLRQLTGELRARVGVAECRSYAMLAAAKATSGQFVVLKPADLMPFFRDTSVAVLILLGYAAVVDALALFGLRSLAPVYALTRRHLEAQFEGRGRSLYALLHPEEELPVPVYEPGLIRAGFDLDAAILENLDLSPRLAQLVDRAIAQLKDQSAQYLELQLHTEKGRLEACRLLKEPLRNRERLLGVAQYLLAELVPNAEKICGLAIVLGGLVDTPYCQELLFAERKPMLTALEAVERRFPAKLLRGIVVDPQPIFHEEQTRFEGFFTGTTG